MTASYARILMSSYSSARQLQHSGRLGSLQPAASSSLMETIRDTSTRYYHCTLVVNDLKLIVGEITDL
ncbi:MAG: hypothetical protein MZV63_54605 [Marinilabiliales bacterium]|nr:hypothetical protein [Marinilabiliales bacterium]